MTAIIPPHDVEDPTPQTPRYGLNVAATGPLELPVRARAGGLRYQTVGVDLPEGFAVECSTSTVSFPDDCGDLVTGTPFVVQATLTAGSLGMPQQLIESRLLTRLRAGEWAVVERIFSEGTFGASPSLANNTPAATAVAAEPSILGGIGALEEWLGARSGRAGVIHVPLVCASRLLATGAIVRDGGGTWRTALGHAVSFGNYAGKQPGGTAPAAGHTTIYITGSTVVWRTPDSGLDFSPYRGNLNTSTNQIAAFVRREYVVTHDGLVAAVDVTVGGE